MLKLSKVAIFKECFSFVHLNLHVIRLFLRINCVSLRILVTITVSLSSRKFDFHCVSKGE